MTGFDARALRNALGQFATGVTVISTRDQNGTPRGITANSFTSVSLDPPLVLVCIGSHAASHEVFKAAEGFSVSVLAEEQKDVSALFATRRADKFDVASWHPSPLGYPIVADALSWFECQVHQQVAAGDHLVLIGHVTDFGYRDGRPLGYYRGSYFMLGHEDELVDAVARGARAVVGAIYEQDGALLLTEDPATGTLAIPSVGGASDAADLETLRARYNAPGFHPLIDFVYAVFENRRLGMVTIYYRGHAVGPAPAGTRFIQLDEIPLDRIADLPSRTMLERYIAEAHEGAFAVYMGDEARGITQPVG